MSDEPEGPERPERPERPDAGDDGNDDHLEFEIAHLESAPGAATRRWWLPGWSAGRTLSRRARIARGAALASGILVVFCILVNSVNPALLPWTTGSIFRQGAQAPNTTTPRSRPAGRVAGTGSQDGIACLSDAAWSADSQRIAVFGYRNGCPSTRLRHPAVVNIYEAATARLQRQVAPDEAVRQAIARSKVGASGGVSPVSLTPAYLGVSWRLDGRAIALPFGLLVAQGSILVALGVELVDLSDGTARVLLHEEGPDDAGSGYAEWDLTQGIYLPVSPSVPFASMAPALGYRWDGATLRPVDALASPAVMPPSPVAPVGNPAGDPAFSIWQPGYLVQVGGSRAHPLYGFDVFFTAWSPDGRYLVSGMYLRGALSPGRTTNGKQYTGTGLPQLPTRDAALRNAVAAISPADDLTGIAWRPDGQRLAAYSDTPGNHVMLYDCATGRVLAELPPPPTQHPLTGASKLLWSPDGTRLLLISQQWGALALWGPGTLPV